MDISRASWLVYLGIPSLALFVCALAVWGVLHAERALGANARDQVRASLIAALGLAAWSLLVCALGALGVLARFDARPPPFPLVMGAGWLATLVLGLSRVGERLVRGLPLVALVGAQAFRLPLELVMHRAASDGVMPSEMSFSGYNFDIVSGTTAALLALYLATGRSSRVLVWGWNVLGLALLCNVVVIAIAATPIFHVFGRTHLNTWVAWPPYVLLPAILVPAALFGHILVFRKLRAACRGTLSAS